MRFLTSRNWLNASPENADRSLHLIKGVVALGLGQPHLTLNGRVHLHRTRLDQRPSSPHGAARSPLLQRSH